MPSSAAWKKKAKQYRRMNKILSERNATMVANWRKFGFYVEDYPWDDRRPRVVWREPQPAIIEEVGRE